MLLARVTHAESQPSRLIGWGFPGSYPRRISACSIIRGISILVLKKGLKYTDISEGFGIVGL